MVNATMMHTPPTSKTFYVYMLHEAPEQEPFWCKVGYSDNPLKRLNELQAGNPRYLRCWEYTRRPTNQFGLPLPDRSHARRLERRIHERLEEMGLRTLRDYDYTTDSAPKREWFAGLHPSKMSLLIDEMYFQYCKEHRLLDGMLNPR